MPKGLLVAVALLAVLGGVTWWSNKDQAKQAEKKGADTATKMLSIPDDQVRQVRIERIHTAPLVLSRNDGGKWQITEPKPLPADQDAARQVVTAVASLNADKVIEDNPADLAQFGLGTPSIKVTVTRKDGKTDTLLVGDETPTSGSNYAKLASAAKVYTIAGYTKTSLDKTPNDLRDRRLLNFDSDKLTRVELNAKGQPVEFGKNNQNDWQILKPRPLRADGSQVEDLVRKLKDAKMDTAASDEDLKKAAAAFSSGTRVATAAVTDAAGSQTLDIRKDKDKNYYAKSSVVQGIFKVASDLGDGVDKSLDDFRNKKIFDFGFSDPSKVELKGAVYTKSGEKWMSGAKQMDSAGVQTLIDKLRDLSSTKFPEKGGGEAVLETTVTSNDGKRVEKVSITKQGNQYFARRENEPTVYEPDSKAVEELLKAAAEVKEAKPEPDKGKGKKK